MIASSITFDMKDVPGEVRLARRGPEPNAPYTAIEIIDELKTEVALTIYPPGADEENNEYNQYHLQLSAHHVEGGAEAYHLRLSVYLDLQALEALRTALDAMIRMS
jgi:hypothetical protein